MTINRLYVIATLLCFGLAAVLHLTVRTEVHYTLDGKNPHIVWMLR